MQVLIKRPGRMAKEALINNSLSTLQNLVGGYIEVFPVNDDVLAIVNEEGKLMGLEYNCSIHGESLVGNVVFCGADGEDFSDCPISISQLYQLMEVKNGEDKSRV